jgi:hypothetical protein
MLKEFLQQLLQSIQATRPTPEDQIQEPPQEEPPESNY